ncbi:glycoside hydrolase family 88 protein [Niabella ginsengisoli]|uniref:glycoside hydrolase family 88 protein n=1 Tax=Niabella ginsengisoli TaxID=522298 RepID=UPI0021D3F9A2|nr:glycoside hydrolase family 88 protein [Niabella ginsengisoli]
MPDLLSVLPKDHKDRPRIMEGYLTMMKSLKEHQRPSGMWNQLINEPDFWAETSGTAMFTYAFIRGIQQGWLSAAEYGTAARKAWLAMSPYIDERNNVTEVCIGTGKKMINNIIMIVRAMLEIFMDKHLTCGVQQPFWGNKKYLYCLDKV